MCQLASPISTCIQLFDYSYNPWIINFLNLKWTLIFVPIAYIVLLSLASHYINHPSILHFHLISFPAANQFFHTIIS